MSKIFKAAIAAVLGLSLCSCTDVQEDTSKEWSRTGYYQDENANFLSVTKSEEETEGWLVGCFIGENAYSAVIRQEGDVLKGSLNEDLNDGAQPITVTVTEEGEKDLLLEIEGAETYHFTPMAINENTVTINISTEGAGFFNALTDGDTYETNEDYDTSYAVLNLDKPAEYILSAKAEEGWSFEKWTKNGEDFSTDEEITVEFTENADFAAVFFFSTDDGQNPMMNFIGSYVCDRARALVECEGMEDARITIEWADSVSSLGRWVMSGRFDAETLTMEYDSCVRSFVEYKENGEIANETVEYENGTGKIVFTEDLTFTWHSDNDEFDDLKFEWLDQPEEQEESDEIIGKLTVLANSVNIRSEASKEAKSVGQAQYGEEYSVYEIAEDGSLTWYRIDAGKWIGGNDSYLSYTENQ